MDVTALAAALADLSDRDLTVYGARMGGLFVSFAESGDRRVAAVFQALAVLAAEEEDRRQDLAKAVRVALDGDEIGEIVPDVA